MSIRSFIMDSATGLNYAAGTWRELCSILLSALHLHTSSISSRVEALADPTDHPVLVLDATLDLACIETQISTTLRGGMDVRDCELIKYDDEPFGRVAVPNLHD